MEWIVPVVFTLILAAAPSYQNRFIHHDSMLYGPMEYCMMEQLNISCKGESVIMMQTAVYGVMNVGRCVKNSYVNIENVDCSNDVITLLDATCSGKHMCGMRIPNENLHSVYQNNHQCPPGLAAYLEVTYRCVDVLRGGRKQCPESHSVKVTGRRGFISSVAADPFMAGGSRIIGSSRCPWYITVDPTQTIKITLYNFQYGVDDQQPKLGNLHSLGNDGCYDAASMRENGRHRVLKVCHDTRLKVYTSASNRIYLELAHDMNVLIEYEAEGCPQLKVQEHAWITKDPDGTLRIRCNHTDETWFLTCKDSTWLGEIGNCSLPHHSWGLIDLFGMGNKFPYGVLIVIGIGVILGIVIGGLLLMCVVAYSRRFAVPKPPSEPQEQQQQDGQDGVWENKAVTNRYTSNNNSSTNHPPLPPPPPPPLPPIPDSFRTRPLPPTTGPPAIPVGRSPSQQHRTTDSLLRCTGPPNETSTHYGSAAVTTFTTFGRRQHLYECPEFT